MIFNISSQSKAINDLRSGKADLDSSGKVPSNQLPSYVDDVLEFDSITNFPLIGESGKIYVERNTGDNYRWSGSAYTKLSKYEVFRGATASANGSNGLVPAPASGNQLKFLRADGTWEVPAGSKLLIVNLDTVTNASGSYTHTTTIQGVTADMKPIFIETSDIGVFDDDIEITTSANAVTLACANVSGTSTVKVSLMVYGDTGAGSSTITSDEFDILAARMMPFTGATALSNGSSGFVPAPSAGDGDKVLKADGTWGISGLDPNDIANNLTTTGSGKVLDARQGKALNDKLVPFTGATAQAAGSAGFVPAPAVADRSRFLCGNGTWAETESGKLIVYDLDTVTNSGGSYTHTTTLSGVTHDMKVVMIEVDNPSAFGATVNVSTADGSITLSCDEVNGTADVTVSCLFVTNANPFTSSEFDILSNRIGSLSTLTTTDKSSIVGAVNELNASMLHENYTELLSVTTGGTHTLNDSLNNYTMLFFVFMSPSSNEKHMLAGAIPVSLFKLYNSANTMLDVSSYSYNLAHDLYVNNDNTITIVNFTGSRFIMYGI